MSKYSDFAKLEFILEMIDDIDYIVKSNKNITNALNDRIGKHAILMCLMQIGESMNKIKDNNLKINCQQKVLTMSETL
jgi:uncharacterized protein with HEPN domain